MSQSPFTSLTTRARLLNGPLSQIVPRYVARLKRGRYSTSAAQSRLGILGHFAHWMSMCHLPIHMVDEECVDFFLRHHLPFCDCASPVARTPGDVHAALTSLLTILRETHVIPAIPDPTGPIAEELKRYNAHMQNARGLASGTRIDLEASRPRSMPTNRRRLALSYRASSQARSARLNQCWMKWMRSMRSRPMGGRPLPALG